MNAIIAQSPVLSDVSFVAEEHYDLSEVTTSRYTTSIIQEENHKEKYIIIYGIYNSSVMLQLSTLQSSNYTTIRFYSDNQGGIAEIYVGTRYYINANYVQINANTHINSILSKIVVGTLQ